MISMSSRRAWRRPRSSTTYDSTLSRPGARLALAGQLSAAASTRPKHAMPHTVHQVRHDAPSWRLGAGATRPRPVADGDLPQTGHTEPVRRSALGYAISGINHPE